VKPVKLIVEAEDEIVADQHFLSPENFKRTHRRIQKFLIELAESDEGDTWPPEYRRWVIGSARMQLAALALREIEEGHER
jgi:hypothetical protein